MDRLIELYFSEYERGLQQAAGTMELTDAQRQLIDVLVASKRVRRDECSVAEFLEMAHAALELGEEISDDMRLCLLNAVLPTVIAQNTRDQIRFLSDQFEVLAGRTRSKLLRTASEVIGRSYILGALDGPEASVAHLDRVLSRLVEPGDYLWKRGHMLRISRLLQLNDFRGAIEGFNEVESHFEPYIGLGADLMYLKAMVYAYAGRMEEALPLLDSLYERKSVRRGWIVIQRIQCLALVGRIDAARDELERLRALAASSGTAYPIEHFECLIELVDGRVERARELARAAIADRSGQQIGTSWNQRQHYAISLLISAELIAKRTQAARRLLNRVDAGQRTEAHALDWTRLALLEGDFEAAARRFRSIWHLGTGYLKRTLAIAHELSALDLTRLIESAVGDEVITVDPPVDLGPVAKPKSSAAREPASVPAEPASETDEQQKFVGISSAARLVRQRIDQAADHEAPVLIVGETGTGKEVAARLIHERSDRADEPFVAVNCGAITPSLMESELFGHIKGAFTGAARDREGLFESAGRGTVFLDEIHALPLSLQAALLRVLENHEVRPVGANTTRPIAARVLVATNESLKSLIAAEKFREDLYFRIARLRIEIPPLRERPEDVPELVRHFLREQFGEFEIAVDDRLMTALAEHPWPGNVRELRNEIERILLLSDGAPVLTADLFTADPEDLAGLMHTTRADGAAPTSTDASRAGADRHMEEEPRPPARLTNAIVRQKFLRALFDYHEQLTQAEILDIIGCVPNTARKDLHALIDEGYIEERNPTNSPRTKYYVKVM